MPDLGNLAGTIGTAGIVAIAAVVGLTAHSVAWSLAARISRRSSWLLAASLLRHWKNPLRLIFVDIAVALALPFTPEGARPLLLQIDIFFGVIGIGWLVVGLIHVGYDLVMSRYPTDTEDNLEARRRQTNLIVLRRFGSILIWVITLAMALLTIPGFALLASALLAGAGVVGIILGIAAGPIIGNFIAGIQIAFTQPIRVDDVVVIDGEWGRIEEITSTYVVVAIWDRRHLVVPLSRIVNEPVEDWTRRSADLLSTVTIEADYRAPVDEIRHELKRILDESDLWDGEIWNLQVTDASDRTIRVRALFDVRDPGTAWDLRCLVRERLIAFLQEHHPQALPTVREIRYTERAA
jgi:small-conductance mechanosensitive channel